MRIRIRRDLFLVAGLALAVRLIYVFQLRDSPFFTYPIVDARYHDLWARDILRLGPGHEGVYFRAPLYPYLLAFIYKLSGGSYLAPRIVGSFLGAATAVLTYLLGLTVARRRGVALAAGLGAAFYGMLVYYDGELLAETLFIPLLLASCLLFARSREAGKPPALLAAGFLLGLAADARPTALVILTALVLDLIIGTRGAAGEARPLRRFIPAAALLLGAAVAIAPVTLHNIRRGDFVLIGSQGGLNLWIGNNPQADGQHALLPGLGTNWEIPEASRAAARAEGRELKPSQVSAHYSKLAWRFILGEPLEAAGLMIRKIAFFWNSIEISNNRDLYFFLGETRIMPALRRLGFWLVGPLALLGWSLARRRKLLPGWFLWIVPLFTLATAAFFVTARYRAPVIPFLLILAALAPAAILEKRETLLDRERIADLALLVILFVWVNANPFGLQIENRAHSHYALGIAYEHQGRFDAAREEYLKALESNASLTEVHLRLGSLAQNRGDFAEAERQYRQELVVNPAPAEAAGNLGTLLCLQGRFEEGSRVFMRGLRAEPGNRQLTANLARCLFDEGRKLSAEGWKREAGQRFIRALRLDPDLLEARIELERLTGGSGTRRLP